MQDPESRVPGLRVAFDDAAMIANDLRNQCKSEATSLRFVVTNGSNM
jgi:hypothetical protein